MEPATGNRFREILNVFLAGLQAGMVGALFFLAWLGISAVLQRLSFWTSENLMASVFYGSAAIHRGVAFSTVAGLALYLSLYSLLGALFALVFRSRLPRFRLMLAGILFGLCWYYFSFKLMWRAIAPLVSLLHIEGVTRWGHVLYGALLARYPVYEARGKEPPVGGVAPESAMADAAADQPGAEATPKTQ